MINKLYKKIIDPIADGIAKFKGFEKDSVNYQILYYGISLQIYDMWKNILLFILAFIFGIVPEVLLLIICIYTVRSHTFGLHTDGNPMLCFMLGTAVYIGAGLAVNSKILISFLEQFYIMFKTLSTLIMIINLWTIYLYAPAPTKKRPIKEKEVILHKRKAVINVIILFIFALLSNGKINTIIVVAVSVCAICVHPIAYKILKQEVMSYEKCDEEIRQ